MTTATTTQAYATLIEANAFLATNSIWQEADEDDANDALLWGRYFIDLNFDCVIDYSNIDEEVKFANSILAYDYLVQGDLFFDNESKIKIKRVKAGTVESETEYTTGKSSRPSSLSKVIAILKPVCNYVKGKLVRV